MKRKVEPWRIERLMKERERISFPEYQRQPNLWPDQKKALLIDSILMNIDIPKLYFNVTDDGSYEVIDGQQRLWAIWQFLDNEYSLPVGVKQKTFSQLTAEQQKQITSYELDITFLQDATDSYLRELFLRLQLGLLLITGEKLHVAVGEMKDFVFDEMPKRRWIKHIRIPARRYAKETLCAQIAINAFSRARVQTFSRTRYEDLQFFLDEYQKPIGKDKALFTETNQHITEVLETLGRSFGERAAQIVNRSYALSIFLLADNLVREKEFGPSVRPSFVEFTLLFWRKLREEIALGLGRKNEVLYKFESMLSSAPGEKYQIERRHMILVSSFEHFQQAHKLPTKLAS